MSVLEKDNWSDRSMDFLISDIFEYDMRRAGLSIIKEKQLLSISEITKLESMEKRAADRAVGVKQRTDRNLKEGLMNGFKECRLKFGDINELTDDHILSVKKDAIFTKKYCETLKISNHIEFVEKNHYEAYLYLNGCEFYWGSNHVLDIKGISENKLIHHKEYMSDVIWNFIRYLCQYDTKGATKYIVDIIDKYKKKELDIQYYRELNASSHYMYIMYDSPTTADYLDQNYLPLVIGNYNFLNVLVPLLNYVM